MTTPQRKIGSGFGARSTADDVLRGIDLFGKLAIVTGGYSGLGLETSRALARAGARVVVPARRRTTGQEAVEGIDGREAGVRAFSVHPGYILTPLQRHLATEEMVAAGWIDEDGNQVNPDFKTLEQGAATQLWAATAHQLAGMGGVYCEDCDIAEPTDSPDSVAGVSDHAPEQAARLWTLSTELTRVNAFVTTT